MKRRFLLLAEAVIKIIVASAVFSDGSLYEELGSSFGPPFDPRTRIFYHKRDIQAS